MSKKVAIVGGGASGLLCAIVCAQAGLNVDLFEQNSKCAKKILVSGNGRCNISNANLTPNDYFSDNNNFVQYALKNFGFQEFEKFANGLGLLLNTLEDGRAYPLSNEAKSVATLLQNRAKSLGVIFYTDTKITDIEKLTTTYKSVVIATGSRAGTHLGGNSDGEEFAKVFGHTIVPTYPSLVQLHLPSKIAHKMSGTKINADVTLLINHKKELMINGDVLFTNYGVSGFAILDLSQRVSVALLNYETVDISINFLPHFSMQQLSSHITQFSTKIPTATLHDILLGLLPLKTVNALLEELKLTPTLQIKDVNIKVAKKVANLILNWRFKVNETHGFRHAEVSGGGVNTTEIDNRTMKSLKCHNLYFCGEVLDVLGRRGGFNFAWSWASGYLAAKDIIKTQ